MKRKFEFNKEIDYFTIDPSFLREGFDAAQGKHENIRIMPLDLRSKGLSLEVEQLAEHRWIKKLMLHHDIRIQPDAFGLLERLNNLEELNIKEFGALDYSRFPRLKQLIVSGGTDLVGVDKIPRLEFLYLTRWDSERLPDAIGAISAAKVRISASKKLTSLEPLCRLTKLESLMMQDLPALKVGKEINGLESLRDLHVEKCGWTDFRALRIPTLRKLFSSKLESLAFIKQLPQLDDLFFWECVDGDLTPVLDHPTLRKINFVPEKKHYSHKRAELQKLLAAKRASGR
jgi:hypothetical protein